MLNKKKIRDNTHMIRTKVYHKTKRCYFKLRFLFFMGYNFRLHIKQTFSDYYVNLLTNITAMHMYIS